MYKHQPRALFSPSCVGVIPILVRLCARYTESHISSLFHADRRAKNARTSGTTIHGRSSRVTAFASSNELNIAAFGNPPRLLLMTRLIRHLHAGGNTTSMKPTSSCIEDNITRLCFFERVTYFLRAAITGKSNTGCYEYACRLFGHLHMFVHSHHLYCFLFLTLSSGRLVSRVTEYRARACYIGGKCSALLYHVYMENL